MSKTPYYEVPTYLLSESDVFDKLTELDAGDGETDDHWLRQDLYTESFAVYGNPAWAEYQADLVLAMLEREGYGRDDVPDLFFTNFKMTDLTSHLWTIDSHEVAGALEAQDRALGRILDYLDREVGDYVVILTADHGHTPSPDRTGAWPIQQGELIEALDRRFDVPQGQTLVEGSSAVGLYLDPNVKSELGITDSEVAKFLNAYTIGDDWGEATLPEGYEQRRAEQVFSAVFPKTDLDKIVRCAFGSEKPTAAGA